MAHPPSPQAIVEKFRQSVVKLSLKMHGCRVIQKACRLGSPSESLIEYMLQKYSMNRSRHSLSMSISTFFGFYKHMTHYQKMQSYQSWSMNVPEKMMHASTLWPCGFPLFTDNPRRSP